MVAINKIDRKDARASEVVNEVFDLFIELGASDEQADFPVVYTNGRAGIAKLSLDDPSETLEPLFETIARAVPRGSGRRGSVSRCSSRRSITINTLDASASGASSAAARKLIRRSRKCRATVKSRRDYGSRSCSRLRVSSASKSRRLRPATSFAFRESRASTSAIRSPMPVRPRASPQSPSTNPPFPCSSWSTPRRSQARKANS